VEASLASVPPSLRATQRSRATRPDHVLANAAGELLLSGIRVLTDVGGSDHWPLAAELSLPWGCIARTVCVGTLVPCRRWLPSSRERYARALASLPAVSQGLDCARQGETVNAFCHLRAAVAAAADAASMLASRPAPSCCVRRSFPNATFFDGECRAAKEAWHSALPSDRHALERQYHSLVRKKSRAHQQDRLREFLSSGCLQQRSFWSAFRRINRRCPCP
jgi:hypothetical protein